ncbi:MAG TPA: winged helix-turn-helix transcriptional regulator [Clostridiales bacterium]|nr:winged helix-turn-helix transcriptional regulator [Clostridiales bacterium]
MNYTAMAKEFLDVSVSYKRMMFKPSALAHGEIGILVHLYKKKDHESFSSGELSNALRLSTGRTSSALKSLEKKGYIKRQGDPNDNRRVTVSITPEGRAYADNGYNEILKETEWLLQSLGEKDAEEYVRITKRILALIDLRPN